MQTTAVSITVGEAVQHASANMQRRLLPLSVVLDGQGRQEWWVDEYRQFLQVPAEPKVWYQPVYPNFGAPLRRETPTYDTYDLYWIALNDCRMLAYVAKDKVIVTDPLLSEGTVYARQQDEWKPLHSWKQE